MQNWKKSLALFTILTLFLFFICCNEEFTSIGLHDLPGGEIERVGVQVDSIMIMNISSNRLRTDGPTENSFGIVGYFRDERIGLTVADFFTEVSIPAGLDTFNRHNDVYSVDSLVLSFAYPNNAWYGDPNREINIKIYELSERMSFATKYFHDDEIEYEDVLLSQLNISPKSNVADSIWTTTNFENVLRFNLNQDRDSTLLKKIFNISQSSLSNREAFKEVLKGFYITCDVPTDTIGALFRINLRSQNSFLRLFYTKKLQDYNNHEIIYGYEKDSVTFPINRESRMFNRFVHDYDEENEIVLDDPNSEKIFLQGMAGTVAQIDFKKIVEAWRDSISNEENRDFDFHFSSITLEFWINRVLGTAGLQLERQPSLAIYEEDDDGDYVLPTFTNKFDNIVPCFFSTNAQGSAVTFSTYNASTQTFTFRIQPEYFDQLARDKDMKINDLYLRPLSPEFDFRQQIINNVNNPDIGSIPRITVNYVKYKK